MDNNFVDLDILLTRIRDSRSRVYFHDAVKAYKAGALRAALSSAWVAVVYDLITKFRELSTSGDLAATTFLTKWDAATANGNTRKLLELETNIITEATEVQLLDPLAETHLYRLREDRNLCAHPAFSDEAKLFEPSPELVRCHLVSAIDLVLSQTPLQGKAIFDQFNADVQSPGFPTEQLTIQEYVEKRYLRRTRPHKINNFGIVLAKSLLKGIPAEWENQREKIAESLVAIRERAPDAWSELTTGILAILNTLEPTDRIRAVAFIANFPNFWTQLDSSTQTALIETTKNTTAEDLTDCRLLLGVKHPELKEPIVNLINTLSGDQLRDALRIEALPELWPAALEYYEDSGSFRGSESNFQSLIAPFSGKMSTEQFGALFSAVANNGQNWNAAGTPRLLLSILKNTSGENWPTFESRNELFCALDKRFAFEGDPYLDVFVLLRTDGWEPPQDSTEED